MAERITTELDALIPLISERLAAGQSVCISPRGTSMQPMLRQGRDTVTLSAPSARLSRYDLPLYRRSDGHYVLHRIIRVGDTYTCIGDNSFVREHGIAHEQVIAVVTSFTRKGKEYSISHRPYRFYCRIWHGIRPVRRFLRKGKSFLGKIKRKFIPDPS